MKNPVGSLIKRSPHRLPFERVLVYQKSSSRTRGFSTNSVSQELLRYLSIPQSFGGPGAAHVGETETSGRYVTSSALVCSFN